MNRLNFRLGVSKIIPKEVGLFAVRNFKKGELVAPTDYYKEVYKKHDQIKKMDIDTRRMIRDFCVADDKGAYVLEDFNTISAPWYMNHSCDGNVGFDKDDNFVAIRNIKKGEELTWDYALGETNPKFKMICKCGSKKCRRVVTGNDWKKLKDREFMLSSIKNL
jgi:SET domain-containing protein